MSDKNSIGQPAIFSKGCLTSEKHGPLMAQIDKYAAISGLGGGNKRYIWEPLQEPNETEIGVLKNWNKLSEKGWFGLLYVGGSAQKSTDRLMALTGCMLRNYVDARFMPLEKALKEYTDNKTLAASVVCIPNLYMSGSTIPEWQKNLLYDLLLQHMAEGKLIIGHIQSAPAMKSSFPAAVYDHLKVRFFNLGGEL